MRAVMIGAGNVATHLAKALVNANVEVVQVWSHHEINALTLAKNIGATVATEISSIDDEADIYFISVKDDAIEDVASQLEAKKGIVVHTSGSVNLDVFADKLENYGVFYPLQTFSKSKEVNFKVIPLCLEANHLYSLNFLKDLAGKLSENVVEVNSEKRKILHLAAVFACNFTNHLYALAEDILTAHQLDFDIIRPLIAETADKVQNSLPWEVQTGPAIRGDETTIKKHEALLSQHASLLTIYQTLSEHIKKSR